MNVMSEAADALDARNETMQDATIDGNPPRRNWFSFASLLVLQTQNAFNDKAAQFLLIPIGAWLVDSGAKTFGLNQIEYILAAIIVLPFILFSPLAGWFSDRFSKTWVLRGASILQLGVLLWIAAAIYYQQLWLAVAGFFMLSVQSVMLSPAKRGIVKELVGHKKLGMASGLMEILAVLAICAGQIITGFWFTARLKTHRDGWDAALDPLLILAAGSVVALSISFTVQRVPVQGHRKFKKSILFEHFGQLKELLSERALRLSAAGAAFFWGYAGYLNLAAISMAKILTKGGDDFAEVSAVMMLAASLGIVMGGALASAICRRNIELGLVPIGGLVMVIGTLSLAVTPMASPWVKFWLFVAGGGGALLLIPLNAFLQDICPPEKRGRILAGLNLLDCLAGLTAVLLQLGLVALGVPFSIQFIGLAIICVVATNYAARLLPQHVLRLAALSFVRLFYRMKVEGAEKMPEKGGVLLVPNHVSYIDAFILSAASPREVRFLMFDGYFKHPIIGPLVKLFNTVPISKTRAKDALRVAAEALEQGDVVCIFPEGQLTRSGVMNEFKRGFEIIARKANAPVLPVAMDGLWGSIFSFERNQFIWKMPYRAPYGVSVNFGDAVPAESADAGSIRETILSLRSEAFSWRKRVVDPSLVLSRTPQVLRVGKTNYRSAVERGMMSNANECREVVSNALQIADTNTLRRGQTVMLDWPALNHCQEVIGVALVQFLQLKIVLVDSRMESEEIPKLARQYGVEAFLGGKTLSRIHREQIAWGVCFDFSSSAAQRMDGFPCLVVNHRVVSMSMPHPSADTATNQHQDGWLKGAWGKLLPGFSVKTATDAVTLAGVSCARLELRGLAIGSDGMVEEIKNTDET